MGPRHLFRKFPSGSRNTTPTKIWPLAKVAKNRVSQIFDDSLSATTKTATGEKFVDRDRFSTTTKLSTTGFSVLQFYHTFFLDYGGNSEASGQKVVIWATAYCINMFGQNAFGGNLQKSIGRIKIYGNVETPWITIKSGLVLSSFSHNEIYAYYKWW